VSGPAAHVVDDDAAIRDALSWLFRSRGVGAQAWESGEAFLAARPEAMSGCVVLDVRMGGMSGVEVHDQLLARGCSMPVIFLTGHGDVPLAVGALKKGAFEFFEKPFNDNQLVDRVLDAMRAHEALRRERALAEDLAARLAQLTPREREVMHLVVSGEHNKGIADALSIAVRTVEVHRAHVFDKMGVRSAVELAGLLARSR
jgi:two-component system response regulator DctR